MFIDGNIIKIMWKKQKRIKEKNGILPLRCSRCQNVLAGKGDDYCYVERVEPKEMAIDNEYCCSTQLLTRLYIVVVVVCIVCFVFSCLQ